MFAIPDRLPGAGVGAAKRLRLLVVAHDVPYPARHGGRRDIWSRIAGLPAHGIDLDLLTWSDEPVLAEARETMAAHVGRLNVLQPRHSFLRATVSRLPTRVLFRRLCKHEMREELARCRERRIDAVLLDGLYGALAALELSQKLGVPLIYRSHNVEHQYMGALARASKSRMRGFIYSEEARRTLPVEAVVRREATLVYDICDDDRNEWAREHAMPESRVLPYVCGDSGAEEPDSAECLPADVLYAGSLGGPSQLHGLLWFVTETVPRLEGLRVVLAGAAPHPALITAARRMGVDVVADPSDMRPLYRGAKVLVNPVFHTAGVNVKTVELLATGRPVVSTTAGSRGLSPRMRMHLALADSPAAFASAVRESVDRPNSVVQRAAVAECHGAHHLGTFAEDLFALVGTTP